jgi:hypothetical protein
MVSIPYSLSPLLPLMEQGTPYQCPPNVIYIQVLRWLCSIYSMAVGKYLNIDYILGCYSIPGIEFAPLNLSKNVAT